VEAPAAYAQQMVAERLFPAKQCTNTFPTVQQRLSDKLEAPVEVAAELLLVVWPGHHTTECLVR